jgi:two-component system cell cycle sensor histidine kinase/response regulator CckA
MGKGHILLVEDNTMVRHSIEATLRGLGYRVTAVASGAQCVQMVAAGIDRVDLLVTDVMMPEMSGKELAVRVRAVAAGLPVLYMSGYDQATLASREPVIAAEHFLQKPFDSEELLAAVTRAMAGKNQTSGPSER